MCSYDEEGSVEQESKSVQPFVRLTFASRTISLSLYSVGQSKAMASPHSRDRKIETTSSLEEQQSPIAKDMVSGKDEIVGTVLWLIYHG